MLRKIHCLLGVAATFDTLLWKGQILNQQDFLGLVDKYLQGKACEEEKELLFSHYNKSQKGKEWNEKELGSRKEVEEKILKRLIEAIQQKVNKEKFMNR